MNNYNKYVDQSTTITPTDDDDPFSEMAILTRIDEKFLNLESWAKGRSKELKKEMFEFIDALPLESSVENKYKKK